MLHWAGSSGSCSRLRGLGVLPARVSKIKLTVGKIVPRNRISLYYIFYPETIPPLTISANHPSRVGPGENFKRFLRPEKINEKEVIFECPNSQLKFLNKIKRKSIQILFLVSN